MKRRFVEFASRNRNELAGEVPCRVDPPGDHSFPDARGANQKYFATQPPEPIGEYEDSLERGADADEGWTSLNHWERLTRKGVRPRNDG